MALLEERLKTEMGKYSIKFKEYLEKHQSVMKLCSQYTEDSDEDEADFSDIKKVFWGEDKNAVELDDIHLMDSTDSFMEELETDLFPDYKNQLNNHQ